MRRTSHPNDSGKEKGRTRNSKGISGSAAPAWRCRRSRSGCSSSSAPSGVTTYACTWVTTADRYPSASTVAPARARITWSCPSTSRRMSRGCRPSPTSRSTSAAECPLCLCRRPRSTSRRHSASKSSLLRSTRRNASPAFEIWKMIMACRSRSASLIGSTDLA